MFPGLGSPLVQYQVRVFFLGMVRLYLLFGVSIIHVGVPLIGWPVCIPCLSMLVVGVFPMGMSRLCSPVWGFREIISFSSGDGLFVCLYGLCPLFKRLYGIRTRL